MSAADYTGLVADVLTVLTILVGLSLTRSIWLRIGLVIGRRRARRRAGCSTRATVRDDFERINETTSGSAATVADEMEWLGSVISSGSDLTVAEMPNAQVELARLADAYDAHAQSLARRVLLNSSIPAVERAQDLGVGTARYLRDLASSAPGAADLLGPPTLTFADPERGGQWALHAHPSRRNRRMAFDLLVAHRRHLTAVRRAGSPWHDYGRAHGARWLEPDAAQAEAIERELTSRRLFDGLLPRLRHAILTEDKTSGRERIVLSTAACSYSSVMLDHYTRFAPGGGPPATGGRVGVLTLSLVIATADDHLVFVRRSAEAGSHRGRLGPAVNGNVELAPRFGILLDVDDAGVPDPVRALCREAREEIGVELDRADVYTTGLATFSTDEEVGTHVLLTTTKVAMTLDELAAQTHRADLIEGRWELGGSMFGLQLPSSSDAREFATHRDACLDWVVAAPGLTPHARSAGLAAIASLVSDNDLPAHLDLVGHAHDRLANGLVDPARAVVREVRIR